MQNSKKCPACLEKKPKEWDLCKECLEIYGSTAADWPEWLRWNINDLRMSGYYDKQISNNETIFYDESTLDEDEGQDFDEHLLTRDRTEMAFSSDNYGRTALPYAPYGDDEEMNIEYRKANGIPEILNIDICDIDPDELDTELLTIF